MLHSFMYTFSAFESVAGHTFPGFALEIVPAARDASARSFPRNPRVLNQLRIARAHISCNPSIYSELQIGYRGCIYPLEISKSCGVSYLALRREPIPSAPQSLFESNERRIPELLPRQRDIRLRIANIARARRQVLRARR